MSTLLEPEVLPPTQLALQVPDTVRSLLSEPTKFETDAKAFCVDSEAAFQVADQTQASLKTEAKQIDETRLEEFVRPLRKLEDKWNRLFAPHIDGRTSAVEIYQQKMRAYRREKKLEAERAQADAERQLREQREAEERRAQALEAKAEQLKTPAAKARVLAEAEQHRQVAALTPETVALSAPEPQTVASNVAELWELEKVTSMPDFLRWLADHPEWHGIISFKTGEMNRMAKQFRNVVPVPGIKFHSKDSFRTKAR